MIRTLEEILALPDVAMRIEYLKRGRRTPMPDVGKLMDDWNPNRHEIMTDKEKYPKITITVEQERTVYDEKTGKTVTKPAVTKPVEPNRIVLPIEQDIVNIQTAFTVGTEPKMDCEPDEGERPLLTAVRKCMQQNKTKYQNRRIVRAWLSELECAEYWYAVKDDGFWSKIRRAFAAALGKVSPGYRLKSVLWSPFRGDRLYPFFDDGGNMIAFSRGYTRRELDGSEVKCFMTVTDKMVYQWELGTGTSGQPYTEKAFAHGFEKIPVIYCHRDASYCDKIRTLRVRLEKLVSNYADCIDYHFFPILMLFGEVERFSGEFKNRVVELTGEGANAAYLTWNQAADTVKLELESLIERIYAMTSTPRISFENLKGGGNVFSGVSFRYVFMGAHMAVENHAEVIGDFMQRRVNFLVSALGTLNAGFRKASGTIDIDVRLQPYMIDSIDDNVKTAVAALQGEVWSQKHAVVFAGNVERLSEELEEIKHDREERQKAEGVKTQAQAAADAQ